MENTPTPEVQKKSANPLMMGSVLVLIVIITGAVVLGVGKGTGEKIAPVTQEETLTVATPQEEAVGIVNGEAVVNEDAVIATDAAPAQAILVEAGSFYYKPSEIRVKKGEKVKIVLNSVDMMHDFNIDELGVKIPVVKAGESASVEFVATIEGEFEYYCSVGEHRSKGQVGKIIVE